MKKVDFKKPPLVFVYLGQKIPNYVRYSMLIACETSHSDVILLSEVGLEVKRNNYKNILIESFYDYSDFIEAQKSLNFDKEFWDGFWLKTLERFFVLKQYMVFYDVNKIFHAEADNIVFDLSGLSEKLDEIGEFIFIPMPSNDIAIASLIYINNYKSLSMLCNYAKEKSNATNEMQILAGFIKKFPNYSKALATDVIFDDNNKFVTDSTHNLDGIFDAAAIGQWLFGIDMRHLRKPLYNHFKNHELGFNKIESLEIYLDADENLNVEYSGRKYKLYNLHIHSKIHKKIYKNHSYMKQILESSSCGNKALISYNFYNRLVGSRIFKIHVKIFRILKKLKNEGRPLFHVVLYFFKKKFKIKSNVLKPSNCTIDVVIPTITKDYEVLNAMIDSLKFIQNKIGRVIIIGGKDELLINICLERNIEFVDENKLLGFGKQKIDYTVQGYDRSGWLFQQLLKLSSDKLVSTEYFLILDSDTIFIEPIIFLDHYENTIFFQSDEYHLPYFNAISTLLPELKPYGVSFVSHGMLFKKEFIEMLKVEIQLNTKQSWYESIISLANSNELSCFSEYELYGNYFIRKSKNFKLYPFLNLSVNRSEFKNLSYYSGLGVRSRQLDKYSSLSFHEYNR